jgi:hypothetical protein
MHSVTTVSKFYWPLKLYVNITLQLSSKKQHTENRSFEFLTDFAVVAYCTANEALLDFHSRGVTGGWLVLMTLAGMIPSCYVMLYYAMLC